VERGPQGRQRPGAGRRRRDRAGQQVPELRLAVEEDLALVGEVAEEGPLGDAGAGGDVPAVVLS
jgi:hypothetical protein